MNETKQPDDNQPRISVAQAAALVPALSKRTIYNYCRAGADPEIPHQYGPGGKILIRRDAIFEWLERFKARPRRKRRK